MPYQFSKLLYFYVHDSNKLVLHIIKSEIGYDKK